MRLRDETITAAFLTLAVMLGHVFADLIEDLMDLIFK